MGRKPVEKRRAEHPETQQRMVNELLPIFLEHGFQQMSMDALAKELKISKATLYTQFESREKMFELAVDTILERINQQRVAFTEESLSYQERFLALFSLILKQVTGISAVLLTDLQSSFPELGRKVSLFYHSWEDDLIQFFELGIKEGEFIDINPLLVSRSLINGVEQIIESDFLQKSGLSLSGALSDLFRLHSQSFFTNKQRMTQMDPNPDQFERIVADAASIF